MRTVSVTRLFRGVTAAAGGALALGLVASSARPVTAVSSSIVISQLYGGGGNSGATLKNDFIELYNRGGVPASLSGWSVQYSSAAGTGAWQVTLLTSVTLQPGQYYLVQEAAGTGGTANLPTPDATGSIAMAAGAGKVALVNNTTALSVACPVVASFIDLVGYGAANCSEASPTPALTNTTAALRNANGASDTDNNLADFTVGAPSPRNAFGSSTPPTGVGSTSPVAVNPGEPILLKVTVAPGTNPASAGLTISANLSSLGGLASQPFFDDGSNGDATAGDNVFSYLFTTSVALAVGTYSVPFTVSDNLSRSTSGSFTVSLQAVGPQNVVISQVYGGGGNTGATFKNDFIELFNRGTNAVSITGWSVQYQSAAGSGTWTVTMLSGALNPGQYYLVQEAQGAGGTAVLPVPDASGTIAMAATAGKVALVANNTALSGSCPTGAVVDLVGFGSTANCFEGVGPASAPSSTTAVRRRGGTGGCTDTDNNGADFFTGAPFPRNSGVAGSCVVAAALPLAIHDIQGTTGTSLYAGELVTTTGVVTGRKSNGFFLQAPDSEMDNDPNTSEGVFVFTSSAPPAAAAVGNYVGVAGTVQEFIPSSDPNSPSVTEIGFSPTVTLFTPGYGLPAPAVLTATDASPSSGLDNLEKFEGMRVRIPSLTVVAPSEGTKSEANATSTSNGVFYGVITGTPRPMREPGIQIPDPLPIGAPGNVPRYDANPERIRVDSDGQPGAARIDVTAGALITELVGPLDYGFRSYTVLPDPATPPAVEGNISAIPVPIPGVREFTVASFNMERFFDATNDPGIDDVALTATAFQNRLNKASLAIRNILRIPDIIGVEEMENLSTLQAVAARVSADAIAAGQSDPQYQAILLEGNDIGGIDVGFLVRSGRVTIDGDALQIGAAATYLAPGGTEALLNDRPSLQVHAIVNVPGAAPFPVTVIVNHLRSLSGIDDPADGNRVRTKRRAQAEYLANHVQSLQNANPQERIVLVGDFNAFTFNDGFVDVMGTIKGTPTPADEVVLASPDLVEPNLVDLVETAPADQQYSFVFDGVAQELDHVLVTTRLLPFVSRFEYARNNADFPEVFRSDATRPERISDHDMVVAYLAVPLTATLSYTGATAVNVGDALAASALAAGPTTGAVSFRLGSGGAAQEATASIADGAASASIPNVQVPRGPQPLTMSFAGDDTYAPATATASIAVSQPTVVSIAPHSAVAGAPVTIAATLTAPATSTPFGGETLDLVIDGHSYAATTDAGGEASFTVTVNIAATYSVSVAYAGNPSQFLLGSAASTTLDVALAPTALAYTGATVVNNGQSLVVSADVTTQAGVVLPPQPLTFTLSNGQSSTGVGSATFANVLATPGPVQLTITFAGNQQYARSETRAGITVLQPTQVTYTGPASSEAGAPVTVTAMLRETPAGDAVSGEPVSFSVGATTATAVTNASGMASVSVMSGIGTFPVSVAFAGDAARDLLASSGSGSLVIRDTRPPVIGQVRPSVTVIRPPNKKMVPVTISVAVSDAVDPNPICRVTGITSNEGSSADWQIAGPLSVNLRAARNGKGNERIYTITVTCTDAAGNAATGATQVVVPHDQDDDKEQGDDKDRGKDKDKDKDKEGGEKREKDRRR